MKQCSILDCASPSKVRGYCSKHYQKWRKYGDPLKQAERLVCVKGKHPWVAENIRLNGTYSSGKSKYVCKPCQQERHRERNLRQYGITSEDFNTLLLQQHSHCALCPATFSHSKTRFNVQLHVDHEHSTGRVRGLLCGRCNLLVGLVESIPYAPSTSTVLAYLRK